MNVGDLPTSAQLTAAAQAAKVAEAQARRAEFADFLIRWVYPWEVVSLLRLEELATGTWRLMGVGGATVFVQRWVNANGYPEWDLFSAPPPPAHFPLTRAWRARRALRLSNEEALTILDGTSV